MRARATKKPGVRRSEERAPGEPGRELLGDGGDATRDRVTWTKWRGAGEVRLVHGLRDKEPQEIPIPPYSLARKVVVALENQASSKRCTLAKITKEILNFPLVKLTHQHL